MMVEGFFDINEEEYNSFISKTIDINLFYNAPVSFREKIINDYLKTQFLNNQSKIHKKCISCNKHHTINDFFILDSGKISNVCLSSLKEKKSSLREDNKKIIRMIMNGDENIKLFQTKNQMEPISLENMNPSGLIPDGLNLTPSNKINVEFHHICYNEQGSKGKIINKKTPINPSYWANNINMFKNITSASYEGINQFMLCVALSPDSHKLIHSLYSANNVLNYLNQDYYDFFNTPFYLKNEGNYNIILDYLKNKGYDIDNFNDYLSQYDPKFSSYDERIKYLSDYKIKKT